MSTVSPTSSSKVATDIPTRLLLGSGPSIVTERVLEALAQPTIGHMDPAFAAIMGETNTLLREAFQTENHATFPVSGTGSAGHGGDGRELRRPRRPRRLRRARPVRRAHGGRARARGRRGRARRGRVGTGDRARAPHRRGEGRPRRDGRRPRRDLDGRGAAARRPRRRVPRAGRPPAAGLRDVDRRPPAAHRRVRGRRGVRRHAEVPELPARAGAVHGRRARAREARAAQAAGALVVLRPQARARLLGSRQHGRHRSLLPPHRADQPRLRAARGAAHRGRGGVAADGVGAPPPRAPRAARRARRARLHAAGARRRAAAPAARGRRRRRASTRPRCAARCCSSTASRSPAGSARSRASSGASASWAPARAASRRSSSSRALCELLGADPAEPLAALDEGWRA